MKKKNNSSFAIAAIAAIVVAVLSTVGLILASVGVFKVNGFLLAFAILFVGLGLIFSIYGVCVKGGYEIGVGSLLAIVGLVFILVAAKLKWYLIVFIAIAALFIAAALLVLVKAKALNVERTDEKEGFKSFYEQKAEKDAEKQEKKVDTEFKSPSDDVLGKK